jgi:hypothetical protein
MTRQIWTVPWKEALWAIAADGCSLVLVAGDYGYDVAPAGGVQWWLGFLAAPRGQELIATLDELREWTGPPPSRDPVTCDLCEGKCSVPCESCDGKKVVSCGKCKGSGSITCDCNYEHPCANCGEKGRCKCPDCKDGTEICPECDAVGKVVPEWNINGGVLCGVPIDRRRLAHTLRGCLDQELTIVAAGEDRIVIRAANMQALVMQCPEQESGPVFKPSRDNATASGRR